MFRPYVTTTSFCVHLTKMTESGFAITSKLFQCGLQHHYLHVIQHGPLPVIHPHHLWGGWEIWKIASNKVFHFEVCVESLLSQLAEGVELFIDLLWGASHPLTSKPTFKVAREAIGFKAICIVVVPCKNYMTLSTLGVQKMIFLFVQVVGVSGLWSSNKEQKISLSFIEE